MHLVAAEFVGVETIKDSNKEADDDRRDPCIEHQRTPGLDLAEQWHGLGDDDLIKQRLAAEQRGEGDQRDQCDTDREPTGGVLGPADAGDGAQRNDCTDHEASGETTTGLVVAGEEKKGGNEQRKRTCDTDGVDAGENGCYETKIRSIDASW